MTRTLPLADIRVLAIEQFGAGPWGSLQLADLGAEVIKIEDPASGGDVARSMPPFQTGTSSIYFESFNRAKSSVALDLRLASGRQVFRDLVAKSDAVLSNLRGDLPRKLEITYDNLAEINPRIVCVSLSGYGMSGPRAGEGAYDATIQALAGWMSITGGPDEPPTKSGLSLVDFAGGYVAALAIVSGVWRARRDGVGGDADLSLFETALSLLNYVGAWSASRGWEPRRVPDSGHQTVIPFQAFAASDGHIVVACAKESLWRRFCTAIDQPELAGDERFIDFAARETHREDLLAVLRPALQRRTVADWTDRFRRHGVPSSPVNDIATALRDEQAVARDAVVGYQHPELGDVRMPGSPFGRDFAGGEVRRGPLLGEQTESILRAVCGYGDDRLAALRAEGVFGPVEETPSHDGDVDSDRSRERSIG